jgi:hypothetical protein
LLVSSNNKMQVKQVLHHAFFLKEHATIQDLLKFLEESYAKLKANKEDIWELAKLIAEISLDNAKAFEKNKMLAPCFTELNRAWKALHPLHPWWKDKIEWQVLRFHVFSHLADYYRR